MALPIQSQERSPWEDYFILLSGTTDYTVGNHLNRQGMQPYTLGRVY